MYHRTTQKWLSLLLAIVMIVSLVPLRASAAVTNYADFMADLKVLETYAQEYSASVSRDAGELVLNFIRTGVERYQDSNWTTLAGQEIVGFTNYVKAQDAEKGTTVMDLRDIVIDDFYLPNGNQTDFGHMFGCMNISYVAQGSADLSGWAGDICDLLQYSVATLDDINNNTDGSVESMAAYIQEHCFGVDASGAFGWDDFYGDMDAYYLITEYKKGYASTFSQLMEAYFTAELSNTDRTVYFMNNRFGVEDSQEAVRKAIYDAYSSDVGIKVLESGRGLSSYNALREACCYAFADYVYSQAKGKLIAGSGDDETASNGYYSVFSNEHSILAPGIEQDINYAQTVDGKQIVYYLATVEVNREDVDILVNYKDNKPPVGENIGMQKVEDQTAALVKNYRAMKDENGDPLYENFNAIVATNGAGYNITNGTPSSLVVMQGIEYYPLTGPGFFAILKDGTAMIGDKADYEAHKAEVKEAITAFGSILVEDGKVCVTKNSNYTSNRASRTAIGITAEGKVVMMVLDGRQLPRSAGGAMEEIAQIMLEAGCVDAINLDGGGSTTYLSKPAGSDDIQLVNTPSDGYARSVATSLVAISTAAPSTAFDHAVIDSGYEYITAGTSMPFSVTGVSNTGNAAPIPDGSYWQVSDETVATIDGNGVFTAKAVGDVTVEYVVNGEVAGTKVIHVVIPDNIKFAEDRITAIYGEPKRIDITVWHKGFPVAFTPLRDAFVFFDYAFDDYGNPLLDFTSDAGVINGLEFIGSSEKGIRTAKVYAALMIGNNIVAREANISLYYPDEATFDFENATQGNRKLAWNREIENAKTTDNQLYRISDPDSPVVIEYTFALDMTTIDIPAQLEPLKSMLPTYQEDATAWTYLLQLAERVCVQTNVTITAEFSKDLAVDISQLKVVNDYFALTSASLDENNVLTLVCNWVNQSQPIDGATANPLCILSGITATVKDTAAYYNNEILIANNGNVSYDIYLAATSLYSFASDPENQATFGLYPYIHEPPCRENFSKPEDGEDEVENKDRGAHFSSQYIDFADTFILNTEIRQGWHEENGSYYYYVDNEPLTGTQLVPDRKDATQKRFYEFDETGKLVSEQGVTGLVTHEGDLYYAVLGVAQTGWQLYDGNNYYFHPDTGKAVDGEYTIREKMNPAVAEGKYTPMVDYTYTFTDHVLTLGDWVYDENINGNDGKKHTGWHYRWAGDWMELWFEVEGEYYFANKNYPRMIYTGYQRVMKQDATSTTDTQYHLFDDRGVFQKDYTGHYFDGTNYVFLKNGVRQIIEGLYEGNGYYYYVLGNGTIVTSASQHVNAARTNGLVPVGTYEFDECGRMIKAFLTVEENFTNAVYSKSVMGRALTITNSTACKVGYLENGQYVELKAIDNGDGTYNFAAPANVDKVMVVLSGDANADGKITAADLTALNAHILGKQVLTNAEGLLAADVNGDGRITAADMSRLKAMILGKTQGW